MDKLQLLRHTNKDFSQAAALCFTETWLFESTLDNALQLAGFEHRADREAEAAGKSRGVLTRSVFTARKPDYTNPNWIRVGLAFGSTIALWTLLFKQHDQDVQAYKTHHGIQ
ncbi:NADH dehydrogenase [ubiquinone] 1 subunit C1, mitochondrial isoform X1 [Rhinoraja longicauda]